MKHYLQNIDGKDVKIQEEPVLYLKANVKLR
jgi:hypothetical protein